MCAGSAPSGVTVVPLPLGEAVALLLLPFAPASDPPLALARLSKLVLPA